MTLRSAARCTQSPTASRLRSFPLAALNVEQNGCWRLPQILFSGFILICWKLKMIRSCPLGLSIKLPTQYCICFLTCYYESFLFPRTDTHFLFASWDFLSTRAARVNQTMPLAALLFPQESMLVSTLSSSTQSLTRMTLNSCAGRMRDPCFSFTCATQRSSSAEPSDAVWRGLWLLAGYHDSVNFNGHIAHQMKACFGCDILWSKENDRSGQRVRVQPRLQTCEQNANGSTPTSSYKTINTLTAFSSSCSPCQSMLRFAN